MASLKKTAKIEASIIIASLRPEQLKRCLASIHEHSAGVEYEVVVVCPFDMERHPRVVHVREERAEGNYNAVAKGYRKAKGEYVIALPDDHLVGSKWLSKMVAFMRPHDNEVFQGRFQHAAQGMGQGGTLLDTMVEKPLFNYWGYMFSGFPCMRKDKLDLIGGLFDSKLLHGFWGDADLGLRVWMNGGRVGTCPDAWIYSYACFDEIDRTTKEEWEKADEEALLQRWEPILGPIFSIFDVHGLGIACPKCGTEWHREGDARRCWSCGELSYTVMAKGGAILAEKPTSVIIPHVGPLERLKGCLKRVSETTSVGCEAIVVADAPDAETESYLASLALQGIRPIVNTEQMGAEAAINRGLQAAKGEYLCFLMSDVDVSPGWLDALRDALEKHREFGWAALSSEHTGFLAGCSMMTREAFQKVGLWDESFESGGGFSDDDYMRRMWVAGYKPHIVEGVRVSHKATGKALSDEERKARFQRNQARFKERYGEQGTNWDTLPRYNPKEPQRVKLNLGSFKDTFGNGWTNIDLLNVKPYIPPDHIFKQWDLRRGIPYPNDSVDLIRMSHVLEHLTLEEGKALLREVCRVLRPGGLARIATPDARTVIRHFMNNDMAFFNAVEQPAEYITARTQCEKLSMLLYSLDYSHRVLYDFDFLKDCLEQAGFSKVFRSVAGFSHSETMQQETTDQHVEISLLVEAIR